MTKLLNVERQSENMLKLEYSKKFVAMNLNKMNISCEELKNKKFKYQALDYNSIVICSGIEENLALAERNVSLATDIDVKFIPDRCTISNDKLSGFIHVAPRNIAFHIE